MGEGQGGVKYTEEVLSKYEHRCDGKHEGEIAWHFPLTSAAVDELLRAAATGSTQTRASVQCCFANAIPGMTCPRPVDGPVAARLQRVEDLYVNDMRAGRDVTDVARYKLYGLLGAA